MNIEISGRNYDVTDRIRTMITSKMDAISKYFHDIIQIRAVLNVEKYRNMCEIIVVGKEHDVKASQEAETMEEAIQKTVDHLKRQAQKNREKIRDHHRGNGAKQTLLPESWQVNVLERGNLRDNNAHRTPRIIKTNNLPIRPMSIEQAALMLDESKNEFIVFQDVDTEKVTVIYKRNDNNFGMIAPEF